MIPTLFQSSIRRSFLILLLAGPAAHAQLPTMSKPPWLGYFAVHEQRNFHFKIDAKGTGTLVTFYKPGMPVSQKIQPSIEIFIEEKMPDGKFMKRVVQEASLTSTQAPTERMGKLTLKGKTAGDAAFEVTVEAQSSRIRYGGVITDKGTLTANPIRLGVDLKFPLAYKAEDRDREDIIKQMKEDKLKVSRADGKKFKLAADKPLSEPPNEVADKDLSLVDVEIGAWKGTTFECSAAARSTLRLIAPGQEELLRGFSVRWLSDPEKDPKGESRFEIEVK